MATLRDRASPTGGERSRGGSVSRNASPPASQTDSVMGEFVGFNDETVQDNPDRFFGELFKGAHFRRVSLPSSGGAGDSVTIRGKVHFDAPSVVITTRGMRVRVSSPALDQDLTQRFQNIQHCNERKFSFQLPIPDNPGGRVPYTVYAESTNSTGGWRTDTVRGPEQLEILTEGGAAVTQSIDYAPYVAGGAAAGLIANRFAGDPGDRNLFLAGGAVAGAGYKRFGDPIAVSIPTPSNTQLALVAAAGLGASLFLTQSGLSDVLGATGDAAGSAIDAGRRAAEQLPSR